MDRNLVIESAYEAIKDGLEWGINEKEYGDFVNGIIAMTDTLLEKLEATTNEDTEKSETWIAAEPINEDDDDDCWL